MEKQTDQKLVILCVAKDVLKNISIAIALAISFAFLAYMAAKIRYVPDYTSSTTFVVSRKGSSEMAYANMTKTQEMIDTFRTVVKSKVLRNRVSEDMNVSELPGTIEVNVVPETNLLTMSVTAEKPETAFRMLKSLMKVYPEVGNKVLGEIRMEVFEEPGYPSSPDHLFSGTRVMRDVFLICFLTVTAFLAFFSYMKDTVKNEKEVKLKLDTGLFAVLYHEKQYKNPVDRIRRRKKKMLLSEPSVSFLYEESIKKISTKLLYQLAKEKAKVVMITSTEAGEGKSTIAMNLSEDLSNRGKKVLLIEGNLRESGLSEVMRVDESSFISWGSCLTKDQNLNAAMVKPEHYGFEVLLNNKRIENSTELLSAVIPDWIEEWKKEMDLIIIDAPPVRRRSDTEVWARCADLSLLVVKQNQAESKYINDSIDMLEGYGLGLSGCIYNDAIKGRDFVSSGYGYGYGGYGGYGSYGGYGNYGKYGSYGNYGKNADVKYEPRKK